MEAVEMKDLKVGWWGCFDPLYGPEKVLSITHYTLGRPEPFGASAGSGVKVLHLQGNRRARRDPGRPVHHACRVRAGDGDDVPRPADRGQRGGGDGQRVRRAAGEDSAGRGGVSQLGGPRNA